MLSKSFINKEKRYVFLIGKSMSRDACTKSNKRITTFSHVLKPRDLLVTPNSRCRRGQRCGGSIADVSRCF